MPAPHFLPWRKRAMLLALSSAWTFLGQPALAESLPAETATSALNRAEAARLPLADQRDFADARRGFIATLPDARIVDAAGKVVWEQQFSFLDREAAPDTVHPGLWRQARLNRIHGLFKVVDRIYQVRGFDIANMTIVEGDSGLIVIDPLTTRETARAALDLYLANRPKKPVVAVIYTHSHADHFGGVRGIVDEADVAAGRVRVIAPAGFLGEAVSENVLAGNAMTRRALYQFGNALPRNERGFVDAGLGKSALGGTVTLLAPTESIEREEETRRVDGVDIVFQLTPATEAPAEMHLYFPAFRALNLAENATHTLHNLLPLRGAQVRDANGWAKYLNEALDRFGERSDVVLAQHHWPTWGRERIREYLSRQRDLYKFIHDQTLHLANQGYTAPEIAERLRLPASLENEWSAQGLYGSLRHNVKAVYQRYLGWYDANPAHLDPLPPQASAQRSIAYMGGAEAVLQRAQADFAKGDYRWVLQIANELVQAEPDNKAARELAARAAEQLGYQAESATWRNAYLQGAAELRDGPPPPRPAVFGADVVAALSLDDVFDYLAVRLNGQRAEGKRIRINWDFTDTGQKYVLNLENSALTYLHRNVSDADLTVSIERSTLLAILGKQLTFRDAWAIGKVTLAGPPTKLADLFGLIDEFPTDFPIVTPRPDKRSEKGN